MAASNSSLLLLLVISAFSSVSAQTEESFADWESIVDYGDAGYLETGNAWRTWPFGPAVGGSYRYLSFYEQGRPRVGSAYWTETMPIYGVYEVMVSFRKTENRTNDANYNVVECEQACTENDQNNELVSQSVISQLAGNDDFLTWESLGQFTWQPGQQVIVHLDGTDDNQSDEADAVKWVLIEEVVAATPIIMPIITLLLE